MALTLKRQSKCLALVEAPLMNGFKPKEPLVVGGHLNFTFMATSGKVGTVFVRTIMGAKTQQVCQLHHQPRVHAALVWCKALLRRPPAPKDRKVLAPGKGHHAP